MSPSTVKVTGVACNRLQEGTGFAAAPNLVVTNAHVVAGEDATEVERSDGTRLGATVVVFDPNRDLAVLAVPGLDRTPLPIGETDEGGTGGVFGHPGGGDLRIAPFEVGDVEMLTFGAASFDRVNDIKDPVVERLGELDTAIEVGPSAGIKINRITNPFDSLTAAVDVKWDVAGAHRGMVVAPSLTFFTPVSRGAAISLALNAEHVDDDFASYYYSISPAGSVASGLPAYTADSGWKSVGANAFGVIDLDGNALNGGFGIILLGGYSRLLGDAKRSPITSIRGSADQWFGAVGLGYTF